MWRFMLLWFAVAAAIPALAQAPGNSCVECHRDLDGDLQQPVKLSQQDVHFQKGLSCHNCHGGDPTVGVSSGSAEDSMNKKKGYIGRPDRKRIASLCASCHGSLDFMRRYNPRARVDQYTEYLTSVHGKKYQAGDPNVAACTDCHAAHGIRPVSNPNSPVYPTNVAETCARCHADAKRMTSYGIPTNQLELYSKSAHADALMKKRDLAAPTCNSCHGNHGATPPGVDSVANVCGNCHVSQWNLFSKSPHKKAFSEGKLPACATCHQHHDILPTSDAMLGIESSATCVSCHEKDSAGYKAAATMKSALVQLKNRLDAARDLLQRAERAGMEVSRPIYDLTEGHNELVRARVEIHSFDPGALSKVVTQGEKIAEASQQSGQKALGELAFRRKGLAISAVILLGMICLLLLKIRQLGT